MPSEGTPRRAIRIKDELWQAALSVAAERGENLSDIIRGALIDYIASWGADERRAQAMARTTKGEA